MGDTKRATYAIAGSNISKDTLQDDEEMDFEDPFGDDLEESESEEASELDSSDIESDCSDDFPSTADINKDVVKGSKGLPQNGSTRLVSKKQIKDNNPLGEGKNDEMKIKKVAWTPGVQRIGDGEKLDFDPMTYSMIHRGSVDWSCLSFDVIIDQLGSRRTRYPHTAYVVAGTQADRQDRNRLFVMKWTQLHKTNKDGKDSDDESDDDDEDSEVDRGEEEDSDADVDPATDADDDAKLDFNVIAHKGTVNRVRVCPLLPRLVATWADTKKVHIWDVQKHIDKLDNGYGKIGDPPGVQIQPMFTYSGHSDEGYAMDWHPSMTGRFLSGSNDGSVALWEPTPGGWTVTRGAGIKKGGPHNRFQGHGGAVEDVKWRVGEGSEECFATACGDGIIRIFDTREEKPVTQIRNAHNGDVNVISWNPLQHDLLLSGGDDGATKVWDMRFPDTAIVKLLWHKEPITSVDWHPTDEATFACASYDDSVTLWDLSVEPEDAAAEKGGKDRLPEQLLFQHFGQSQITELKFHPQIPGVVISTAVDGFNIFKTCNV